MPRRRAERCNLVSGTALAAGVCERFKVDVIPGVRTEWKVGREHRTCLGVTPVDRWFGSESHLNPNGQCCEAFLFEE
jgi:hypothetical protein